MTQVTVTQPNNQVTITQPNIVTVLCLFACSLSHMRRPPEFSSLQGSAIVLREEECSHGVFARSPVLFVTGYGATFA